MSFYNMNFMTKEEKIQTIENIINGVNRANSSDRRRLESINDKDVEMLMDMVESFGRMLLDELKLKDDRRGGSRVERSNMY
jgi:hypothetical protein